MSFTLYPEDSPDINEQWFQSQLTRYGKTSYKACFEEELVALQAFYNRKTSVQQAAKDITQPISKSPLKDLGGYSDDIVALCQLWYILKNALIEWPASRTADIVALMKAITRVNDPIHRGELLDEDGQTPLSWAGLPWFTMVWSDAFWRTPGQIVRQATDEKSRQHELAVYIKQQDVEARLVAAGLLDWDRAPRYMIKTLERKPGPDDIRIAPSDGEADNQLKLDFQIPGVSKWVDHNGDRLYSSLDEVNDWDRKRAWGDMIRFDPPSERWAFWQRRLHEIAEDDELETPVRDAASSTLQYMKKVKAT